MLKHNRELLGHAETLMHGLGIDVGGLGNRSQGSLASGECSDSEELRLMRTSKSQNATKHVGFSKFDQTFQSEGMFHGSHGNGEFSNQKSPKNRRKLAYVPLIPPELKAGLPFYA